MVTFLKNAKKFLDLKNANEAYHALHYVGGRVYASSPQTLIWLEGEFGKRGSYDFARGEKLDVQMPEFERIIPQVGEGDTYAFLAENDLETLHTMLKNIAAIAAYPLKLMPVYLTWNLMLLRTEVQLSIALVSHTAEGCVRNMKGGVKEACANAKLFADMVDYFRQRKTDVRLYAPLCESRQSPMLFMAEGTGGVLSQVRDAEIWQD